MVRLDYPLFPSRLLTVQFPDTARLNADLRQLVDDQSEHPGDFNMHPSALNWLRFADSAPCIAQLRDLFLEGARQWLVAEQVTGPTGADLVLFSNSAGPGEFTLPHNHNADLVGIYYVQTPTPERPIVQPHDDPDDYFDPGDGLLVLHDPRFNANLSATGHRDHVKVYPRPGLLLIFPGYIWHTVTPHLGPERRLSFAMNFTLHWPGGPAVVSHTWG